jgi:DNA-directed RNA polymerase II subunit RPB1
MTCNDKMVSIFRHGINNDDIGPIAKASFEETPEMFLKAARHAELDLMRGVSANVMCGQEGYFGTNSFQVVLDIESRIAMKSTQEWLVTNTKSIIETELKSEEDNNDLCSNNNLQIESNVKNIKHVDLGISNDYDPGF